MATELLCPQCLAPLEDDSNPSSSERVCAACGYRASEQPGAGDVGRFQLTKRLGSGSFGEVWEARDRNTQETFALKISWRTLDDAHAKNIAREASVTMQLEHPNIARVREVGNAGDRVFIVGELVRGVTLDKWRKSHKPTPLESIRLCGKLAEVLHYAHGLGVVHRDLKPSNVMVDAESQPHLLDFGLARDGMNESLEAIERYQAMRHALRHSDAKHPHVRIMGTPAYMSPEQANGKAYCVDGRSDIYSLGVILYEFLTGRQPFSGPLKRLRRDIIRRRAKRPRRFNRKITRDIQAICMKAMAKKLGDRYETAEAMAIDCAHAYAGEPIASRPQRRRVWSFLGWRDRETVAVQ